jgi:hypothetical protein
MLYHLSQVTQKGKLRASPTVSLNLTLQMSIWPTLHLIWQVKLVVYSNSLSIYYLHHKCMTNRTHMSAYTNLFPPHSPVHPLLPPFYSYFDCGDGDSREAGCAWRQRTATHGRRAARGGGVRRRRAREAAVDGGRRRAREAAQDGGGRRWRAREAARDGGGRRWAARRRRTAARRTADGGGGEAAADGGGRARRHQAGGLQRTNPLLAGLPRSSLTAAPSIPRRRGWRRRRRRRSRLAPARTAAAGAASYDDDDAEDGGGRGWGRRGRRRAVAASSGASLLRAVAVVRFVVVIVAAFCSSRGERERERVGGGVVGPTNSQAKRLSKFGQRGV